MLQNWRFVIDGEPQSLQVQGDRIANNGEQVKSWGLAGRGIIMKSEWDVYSHLAEGRLVLLLEAFMPEPNMLQLVSPKGHTQPRRVLLLKDYLAKHLKESRPQGESIPASPSGSR
jgi:DNA-binding transcriptional LysR family regulator